MTETKSTNSNNGVSGILNLAYLVLVLVFMYANEDWLTNQNVEYQDFVRIGAIVSLFTSILLCCFGVCIAFGQGSSITFCAISMMILTIFYNIAYDISSTIFFYDKSNFTNDVNNSFRLAIAIIGTILSVFNGVFLCVLCCALGIGVSAS